MENVIKMCPVWPNLVKTKLFIDLYPYPSSMKDTPENVSIIIAG